MECDRYAASWHPREACLRLPAAGRFHGGPFGLQTVAHIETEAVKPETCTGQQFPREETEILLQIAGCVHNVRIGGSCHADRRSVNSRVEAHVDLVGVQVPAGSEVRIGRAGFMWQ